MAKTRLGLRVAAGVNGAPPEDLLAHTGRVFGRQLMALHRQRVTLLAGLTRQQQTRASGCKDFGAHAASGSQQMGWLRVLTDVEQAQGLWLCAPNAAGEQEDVRRAAARQVEQHCAALMDCLLGGEDLLRLRHHACAAPHTQRHPSRRTRTVRPTECPVCRGAKAAVHVRGAPEAPGWRRTSPEYNRHWWRRLGLQ